MAGNLLHKWIEVDLTAIDHNLTEVRSLIRAKTRLIAVLKADAYGMGAVEVGWRLAQNGVDYFAVSFLQEALELRAAGLTQDILVFAPLAREEVRTAIENRLSITVASADDLRTVCEISAGTRRQARVQIKVDTGLGRFGASPREAVKMGLFANVAESVILEGVYTHFSEGGQSARFTRRQYQLFSKALNEMARQGVPVPLRHCASSSTLLRFPDMQLDAVRVGTLLDGQMPAGSYEKVPKLKDPFRFRARVSAVRFMKKGSYIGYSRTYRLKKDSWAAVIPAGLADGLGVEPMQKAAGFRDLLRLTIKAAAGYLNLNRVALRVRFRGSFLWIRGKVFMQFCIAEVPDHVKIAAGDTVDLPVRRTQASKAVPRCYIYRESAQPAAVFPMKESYATGEE